MTDQIDMYVTKRNGEKEVLSYNKILTRTKSVGKEFGLEMNYTGLVMKVIDQLFNNIKTSEIDELMAQQCASLGVHDYRFSKLAGLLVISNHQKEVNQSFYENTKYVYENNPGYLHEEYYQIVNRYHVELENMIQHERDYLIDFFGFKTLERAYLIKVNKKIHERIQHLWLRVAIQIHGDNLERVKETYDGLSQKYFIHATPTLFNAGTARPQLSSCYLLGMESDSIDGIFNTLKDCASISKWAGGIGLHIHNVRAEGSHIVGTNGTSNGIVPMLRVFNNTARYVDQCVVPETYIYTTEGPKQIQYVKSGIDHIFNQTGGVEVVQNVLEHAYSGDILKINTVHSIEPLMVTEEHPILSIQGQKRGLNYTTIKNRIEKKLVNIDYHDARDIDNETLIAFSIPQHSVDNSKISEDDCYMYGLMLGDGCANNKSMNFKITLGTHAKSEQINFVKQYLSNKFIHYTISDNGNENGNTTSIIWSRNIDFPFRYADLYNDNKEKSITPMMLNLPIEKSSMIIKGLIMSDGCVYNEIVFDNTSRPLVEQFKYLLLKMGVLSSGYIRDRRGECHEIRDGEFITTKKICYSIRVPKTKEICKLLNIDTPSCFVKFFRHENLLFTRVESITKTSYTGVLYDLQMEKEHNYMIHNGIIHNGGGKRSGSFAMYLEPWHGDIEKFLELRKNHGDEEARARDLFYALWIPDLFMEKVEKNEDWYLMCPNISKGLHEVYGDDFKQLYEKYISEGKFIKKMKARDLWFQVLDSQMETGTPYMLYKDACNKKSNQKNLGVIKSSNLCTEIIEHSDADETAVCNLASISLSAMVNQETKEFDYNKLCEVTKIVTRNLNNVIDINFYPTDKTYRSNMRHRPIGLGVQGLADALAMMDIPFHSERALEVNKNIFETIYYGSMYQSNQLAMERQKEMKELRELLKNDADSYFHLINSLMRTEFYSDKVMFQDEQIFNLYHKLRPLYAEIFGKENVRRDMDKVGAYSSFEGSPLSEGKFQFDLWNVTPGSGMYNWEELRHNVMKYGVRNSLCVAPMPTASTSQILANNECFEPFTSNIYTRRTLAGEFIVINRYLMKELTDMGLWTAKMKDKIIENKGSVQNIDNIPESIKEKYKIVWEIPMKHVITMARDRGAYICQSQSMNLWLEDPNYKNLTAMHLYSWKSGLKTGIYYLRRKAKHQAQQFTIEPELKASSEQQDSNEPEEPEECLMCGA